VAGCEEISNFKLQASAEPLTPDGKSLHARSNFGVGIGTNRNDAEFAQSPFGHDIDRTFELLAKDRCCLSRSHESFVLNLVTRAPKADGSILARSNVNDKWRSIRKRKTFRSL